MSAFLSLLRTMNALFDIRIMMAIFVKAFLSGRRMMAKAGTGHRLIFYFWMHFVFKHFLFL